MKASYWTTANKGYNLISKEVGDLIDFYNILYIEEGNTNFDSYNEIFGDKSHYSQRGTIAQLISEGVPSHKLVLAKTITRLNAGNGYISPVTVGEWTSRAYEELGWYAGVALWEYNKDRDGAAIKEAIGAVTDKVLAKRN